jgi:DNA-binding transcriptional regulator YiaG
MQMIDLSGIESLVKQGANRKTAQSLKTDFAKLTTQVRSKHNLSQRDLAKLLEVTQATVSRWELAQAVPSPWEVKRIVELFHAQPMNSKKDRGWNRPPIGMAKDSMNMRDYFAIAALPAIIQNKGIQTPEVAADTAYQVADAMMKARAALEGK